MAGSLGGRGNFGSHARLKAFGLVAPLVIFVGVTFVAPLGTMLVRSVYDPVVADAFPETLELLETWDGERLPSEAVYVSIAKEIERADANRTLGRVAGRLNRVKSGLRSAMTRTARGSFEMEQGSVRASMVVIDSIWADPQTWRVIQITGERFTARHYQNAVDLQQHPDGSIAWQPEERRIYLQLFWRTLVVSGVITLLCLI